MVSSRGQPASLYGETRSAHCHEVFMLVIQSFLGFVRPRLCARGSRIENRREEAYAFFLIPQPHTSPISIFLRKGTVCVCVVYR